VAQSELVSYYSAADLTILASGREGMANVLLESLACGTPLVATNVGGNAEVIGHPAAGTLVVEHTAEAVATGVRAVLGRGISRTETRAYAERFGWDEPISTQMRLFEEVIALHRTSAPSAAL
jgi:glycosyltransferase involved in cell wall biosynthesis